MKRRKKLLTMGAVLVVVLAVTVFAATMDRKSEQIRESGEPIVQISPEDVTALSWEYRENTLSFAREEEVWKDTADADFPVSEEKIHQMLSVFENLGAAFVIEDVEDYGQYGLDQPVTTISVSTADQTYEIRLGAYSKMDQQRYADIGDGNVYLLAEDPMDEFEKGRSYVMQQDVLPDLSETDRLSFRGAEQYSIVNHPENGHSYREDDTYFAQLGENLLPLDPLSVEQYLSKLNGLSLTDCKTYTAGQEDLTEYGLAEPELTVTAVYQTDGAAESVTVELGRNPETVAKAQEDDSVRVPGYLRLEGSELVYEIPEEDYQALAACGYNDLRYREIFPADPGDIASIRLELDGGSYELTAEPEKKDLQRYLFEEQEVEAADLLTALSGIRASEFLEEAPGADRELKAVITLESGESVSLDFYRRDGASCLAAVDGSVIGTVPRDQVVKLREAANAIVLGGTESEN